MGVPLRGPSGVAGQDFKVTLQQQNSLERVGGLAGRRREPGAQALPGQHRLPQGRQALPPSSGRSTGAPPAGRKRSLCRQGKEGREGPASSRRVGLNPRTISLRVGPEEAPPP